MVLGGGEVLIGMLVEVSCGERSNWSVQRAEFQEWDPGALRGGEWMARPV